MPSQPMISIDFQIHAQPEDVNVKVRVPLTATNLTGILPNIQEVVEQTNAVVFRQLQEKGQTVSCRAGCGACCRQLVFISLFEAEALADWMRELPAEKKARLGECFASHQAKLLASGMLDRLQALDWRGDGEGRRQLSAEYFRLGLACPFLEEESCSIHAQRPLICREYNVITPPERCAEPELEGVVRVGFRLRFSRVLQALGAEVDPEAKGWIPLVRLFEWMELDLHPGAAVAGNGPEVLFALLSHLPEGESESDQEPPAL